MRIGERMPDINNVTVPVGGMHCQNCVNSVQKKLSAIPGIKDVRVDLGKGLVSVQGSSLDVAGIRAAIEELGFDAGEPV